MNLGTTRERFLLIAFIGLTSVAVWPTREANAQRRRQAKSVATVTVKASVYYEVGGFQPVPPMTFVVLDEDPEALLSFLGEAPVATYAVAKLGRESLEVARIRIQLAQERNAFMREQLEDLLNFMRQSERLEARAAFDKNERYVADNSKILKASAIIFNSTIARQETDSRGVAIFRGLPTGKKVYLFGMAPTRGGVVVWLLGATLTPGRHERLELNQTNALVAF